MATTIGRRSSTTSAAVAAAASAVAAVVAAVAAAVVVVGLRESCIAPGSLACCRFWCEGLVPRCLGNAFRIGKIAVLFPLQSLFVEDGRSVSELVVGADLRSGPGAKLEAPRAEVDVVAVVNIVAVVVNIIIAAVAIAVVVVVVIVIACVWLCHESLCGVHHHHHQRLSEPCLDRLVVDLRHPSGFFIAIGHVLEVADFSDAHLVGKSDGFWGWRSHRVALFSRGGERGG